jgi:hypothetical protein
MEFLTDGFLDEASVSGLCPAIVGSALKRAIENLLAVGSWERVPGGYTVHGYLEHNLSKVQVESDRVASRERYRTWKSRQLRSQQRPDNAVANAVDNGVAPPLSTSVHTPAPPNAAATPLGPESARE